MTPFESKSLPAAADAKAPDGSDVRVLLGLSAGGMAHFQLPPGHTSIAVTHCTVEEIWYVLSGEGQMWRRSRDHEEVLELLAGLCLTIPLGTSFQFRATGSEPLQVIAVTMPPWPGEQEATPVEGHWTPSFA